MSGWAHDPGGSAQPARFYVLVDGVQAHEAVCNVSRPDVARAGLAPPLVGYRIKLPRALLDGRKHRVELRDMRRLPVLMRLNDQALTSFDFECTWRPVIRSFVDGLRSGGLEGWVLQEAYETGALEGGCNVRVTCDGVTIGHARANLSRADVGRSLSATARCGFRFVPPASIRRNGKQEFRFYVMPGDIELERSPVTVSLVSDHTEARLLAVSETIDRMHVELTRLRREMRELLPKPLYALEDYGDWYPPYAQALRRRVVNSRASLPPGTPAPLVSVICPVWRPNLDEFAAAVESVQAQTYAQWELILVDDGSGDAALADCIAGFTAADRRIKAITLATNGGISRATNAGLAAAAGDWVAFFDHDDLLADVALEVMVRAAQATGGRMLYSDEDKLSPSGIFTTPAFKPDWNHRLMLGVNYVCHLLMVERAALEAAGPLDSRLDGAQDHDLVLRLSEHLAPREIVHVPEVLYHWRITAGSTALDVGAKPYAIDAGIRCVERHLRRLGRPATVTNLRGTTLYHQRWDYTAAPDVEIIIPYKDEIATTRACVDAILKTTRYRNYRVTLIDNWSTSLEAAAFAEELRRHRTVRVIRMEEPFNYARLNNVVAEQSTAEFLMFMNNDLFVSAPNWLRACVDEALADRAVAMVGGKFVYPTGNVQHAGVTLGVGGVASHVGIGLPPDDFGYGLRLLFAQEYAAVTAAGVLVRRSVFEAMGGFDEHRLTVAFNDVDLCLKVRAAGYKVIYTPDFAAEHHESLSRGDDERPAQEARFFHENQVMKERWGDVLLADPFYNKNLSLERGPFTELRPPEEAAARDWTALRQPPAEPPALPRPAPLPEAPDPPPRRLRPTASRRRAEDAKRVIDSAAD